MLTSCAMVVLSDVIAMLSEISIYERIVVLVSVSRVKFLVLGPSGFINIQDPEETNSFNP